MGIPSAVTDTSLPHNSAFIWSSPMVSALIMENTGPSSGRNRIEYWVDVDQSSASLTQFWLNPLSVCPPAVCLSTQSTDRLNLNQFYSGNSQPVVLVKQFLDPIRWYINVSYPFGSLKGQPKCCYTHLYLSTLSPPPQRVRVNAVLSRVLGYQWHRG